VVNKDSTHISDIKNKQGKNVEANTANTTSFCASPQSNKKQGERRKQ